MSFFTCFCDLPQKEHFSSSPPSPNFATIDDPPAVRYEAAVIGPRLSASSRVEMTSSMMP